MLQIIECPINARIILLRLACIAIPSNCMLFEFACYSIRSRIGSNLNIFIDSDSLKYVKQGEQKQFDIILKKRKEEERSLDPYKTNFNNLI